MVETTSGGVVTARYEYTYRSRVCKDLLLPRKHLAMAMRTAGSETGSIGRSGEAESKGLDAFVCGLVNGQGREEEVSTEIPSVMSGFKALVRVANVDGQPRFRADRSHIVLPNTSRMLNRPPRPRPSIPSTVATAMGQPLFFEWRGCHRAAAVRVRFRRAKGA